MTFTLFPGQPVGNGFVLLNQNSSIPSWAGVFLLGIFLSIALSEFRCTIASKPSSSDSFSRYLSIHHFRHVFSFSLFYSKIIFFLFLSNDE